MTVSHGKFRLLTLIKGNCHRVSKLLPCLTMPKQFEIPTDFCQDGTFLQQWFLFLSLFHAGDQLIWYQFIWRGCMWLWYQFIWRGHLCLWRQLIIILRGCMCLWYRFILRRCMCLLMSVHTERVHVSFSVSSYWEGACVSGVSSYWEGACVSGISSYSGKEYLCAVLSGIKPATFITMSLVLYHWTVTPPCPANGNCAYQSHQHCGAVMYILKVWSDSTWLGANKATLYQSLNQKQPTASRRNTK